MMIKLPSAARWPAGRPCWPLLLPLLLATMVTAARSIRPGPEPGGEAPGGEAPGSPSSPSRTPASATAPSPSAASSASSPATGETPIKIMIADTVITARLADNATARDLAAQLPLTLTFTDFNQVEKIAKLPRPLTMDGVPAGADPDIRDIGYYAPSGDLVFYYGDVGYFNGIVRIGRFDTSMDQIERQGDTFQAKIERA
jgi:hypothetical protein